jgi:hypothetical protein
VSQAAPAPGSVSVTLPTVDWAQLIPQLVGLFFSALGTYLNAALHGAFDNLWGSGANVLGQTDLAMTWNFGPIADQVASVQTAARAILVFALVLLGLKSMLGGIVQRHSDVLGEFVDGVLMAVILLTAFPVLVPEIIRLTNQAATAVGTVDLSGYLATGGAGDPVVQAVLFVVLLFFAFRLLKKGAWRIGFLAVLLPVGMAACALYAIPQTRWLLAWWVRVWGGMLLAQIPSVLALTIGAQLFAHGSGLGAFVYSIAFLELATDLYTLIPFGSVGGGGAPWGALPQAAALRMAGMALGGAGAAATTLARTEARYPWPAGATTESVASMYGYQ